MNSNKVLLIFSFFLVFTLLFSVCATVVNPPPIQQPHSTQAADTSAAAKGMDGLAAKKKNRPPKRTRPIMMTAVKLT